MKHILFVCHGNICRSPLAEGIAHKIIKDENLNFTIDSAGISGWHEKELACSSSIKIAALNDIDISQMRARQIKIDDAKDSDYVVAMDSKNIEALKKLNFNNLYLLGNFGGYKGIDIPDPYFLKDFDEDVRDIYAVYSMIETCVTEFMKEIVATESIGSSVT